jgi:hypothetical protein
VRGTVGAELALCEKVRINYLLLENVTESRCVENVLPVYPGADLVDSLTLRKEREASSLYEGVVSVEAREPSGLR